MNQETIETVPCMSDKEQTIEAKIVELRALLFSTKLGSDDSSIEAWKSSMLETLHRFKEAIIRTDFNYKKEQTK